MLNSGRKKLNLPGKNLCTIFSAIMKDLDDPFAAFLCFASLWKGRSVHWAASTCSSLPWQQKSRERERTTSYNWVVILAWWCSHLRLDKALPCSQPAVAQAALKEFWTSFILVVLLHQWEDSVNFSTIFWENSTWNFPCILLFSVAHFKNLECSYTSLFIKFVACPTQELGYKNYPQASQW